MNSCEDYSTFRSMPNAGPVRIKKPGAGTANPRPGFSIQFGELNDRSRTDLLANHKIIPCYP